MVGLNKKLSLSLVSLKLGNIYFDSGWSKFHDYCYKPIVAKETWFDAEQRCTQVYDSHLAHIETARHLEWMWTLADRQPFWIGKVDMSMSYKCIVS